MNVQVKYGIAVLSIFLLCDIISAQDNRDLSSYVPEDANVLVMVNEVELFDSPMAKRLYWKAEKKKSYAIFDDSCNQSDERILLGYFHKKLQNQQNNARDS